MTASVSQSNAVNCTGFNPFGRYVAEAGYLWNQKQRALERKGNLRSGTQVFQRGAKSGCVPLYMEFQAVKQFFYGINTY